jgi:hypothetical protein
MAALYHVVKDGRVQGYGIVKFPMKKRVKWIAQKKK